MSGGAVGTLAVAVKTASSHFLQLWSRSGDQGDAWHLGVVRVGKRFDFEIVVQAAATTVLFGSRGGDIAVDDFAFENCEPGKRRARPRAGRLQ